LRRDAETSRKLWREIFGDKFGEAAAAVTKAAQAHVGRARDTEQFLERDPQIPIRRAGVAGSMGNGGAVRSNAWLSGVREINGDVLPGEAVADASVTEAATTRLDAC
jgi:hypothetical protein